MGISREKLSLIHVAKARLGMAEEDYRALLRDVAGVDSSSSLDDAGFERLMLRFEALGFQSNRAKRGYGRRPGMATPAQVEYIRSLWTEYTGSDNETSLNHWLENSFGVTALRFADTEVAGDALTALKAMVARRKG
jgi:hypothetical protein